MVFDSSEEARRPDGELDAFLPPSGLWPLPLRPSGLLLLLLDFLLLSEVAAWPFCWTTGIAAAVMTPTVELSTSLGTGPKEELVFFRMDLRPLVPPTELLLISEEAAVVTLDDLSVATTSEVDTTSEEVVVLAIEEEFVVTDWPFVSEELLATEADLMVASEATLSLLLPDTVTDFAELISDDFLALVAALLPMAPLDAFFGPVDVCLFTSDDFLPTLDFFPRGPEMGAGVMDTMTSLAFVPLF